MIHYTRKENNIVFTVPNQWNSISIDDFFKNYWHAPKKFIHEWRMSKEVTVNNEKVLWSSKLN